MLVRGVALASARFSARPRYPPHDLRLVICCGVPHELRFVTSFFLASFFVPEYWSIAFPLSAPSSCEVLCQLGILSVANAGPASPAQAITETINGSFLILSSIERRSSLCDSMLPHSERSV